MEKFKCSMPRVEFGNGKAELLGDFVKEWGNKAFLAIDPYLDKTGFGDEIISLLKKSSIEAIKYTDISPNPDCFGADKAAEIAKKESCGMVIAIGGGSPMDFGKAVAVIASHPGTSWQYTERSDHKVLRPSDKTLPIVCIPTTAGTGSEVTHYSVLNNTKIREKSTIISEKIIPKVAIVDPELMCSMPPQLTAHTGIDALAHAIESYINVEANSFNKMVCLEAIRLVAAYLPEAVANGNNKEAREKMAWASTLGGVAIAHVGPTLPHAMGQAVGGFRNSPHGGSVSACLPKILEFSFVSNLKVFAEIAEAMDPTVRSLPLRERAEKCSELVKRLFKDIHCDVRFRDYGLKEEDIEKVTSIALTGYYFDVDHHPKKTTADDIRRLYRECL
jgi:alcohol dehydrogenase class IV